MASTLDSSGFNGRRDPNYIVKGQISILLTVDFTAGILQNNSAPPCRDCSLLRLLKSQTKKPFPVITQNSCYSMSLFFHLSLSQPISTVQVKSVLPAAVSLLLLDVFLLLCLLTEGLMLQPFISDRHTQSYLLSCLQQMLLSMCH